MKVRFFKNKEELRNWFLKHHAAEQELWIGFYKKGSVKKSVTYPESVEEALCFGWIDGIRKKIDDTSYTNRFTPRRRGSNWSLININKVKELKKAGLMQPAGLSAYELRDKDKSGNYSFEKEEARLDEKYERIFKKNKAAWKFFNSQAPSYKKTAVHLLMSGKREETRLKRLEELINCSQKREKIPQLKR
jgi:uncharacterized protein YdeI (YjbR/CyaY-like superfamily)